MLKLSNSLTNRCEQFVPLEDATVRMYVCGITPYDDPHIGHGRCYVLFDFLYRLLDYLGYRVLYCRNFTDIDDRLLAKAERLYQDQMRYREVAEVHINNFHNDISALNCIAPTFEPRVTDNIEAIIAFIEHLVNNEMAYQSGNDVYFSIASTPQYGQLSKQNIAELRAGARVEANEKKRDPLDFALWKGEANNTFWRSPWGWGRPGWHIECSALARKYLGEQIDIHGGGMDLLFPHHENEIAQTEALTNKPFARYWIHNAFVQINKEKMSKSLNNFFTLRDVFKQFDPMVLRFYFLNHHYKAPLEFSFELLTEIEKSYRRLCKFFSGYEAERAEVPSSVEQKMIDFLLNDLNSVGMFGVLFQQLNTLTEAEIRSIKWLLTKVLGLTLNPLPEQEISIEAQKLIDERNAARSAGNWKRADELRDQLKALGVEVQDKKR
jgi:cysteinyl-tRNA synthetase